VISGIVGIGRPILRVIANILTDGLQHTVITDDTVIIVALPEFGTTDVVVLVDPIQVDRRY